jgi:hypothetical protein
MEKGFSDIIANGMQNSNTAFANAMQNFGGGLAALGEGAKALRQRNWNKEYEKLQGKMSDVIGSGGPPEQTADIERQMRGLDIIGNVRGLRTAYTPQDYMNMDLEREKLDWQKKNAEAKALADEAEAAAHRDNQISDKFSEADWLKFDALKEHEANGGLLPETRSQLLNAIVTDQRLTTDEKKQQLLGELSAEKASKLRSEVEKIAKSAGTEFNQALKKAMGGSYSDIPKLLAAIPAVMAQGWAGKDTDTALRIKNAIDRAFDSSLDAELAERAYRGYSDEQMRVGKAKGRNRAYKSNEGTLEDFL